MNYFLWLVMLWLTVVMYLRFSQRANADGTVVRYVALAHNRRVDGKVKPDVLMNLGRVDRLDVGAGRGRGAAPTPGRSAPRGCWTRFGPSWRSAPRSGGSLTVGGSPRRWSGCCSRWSATGRSRR